MTDVWSFIGDDSNRAVLTWLGSGLVIVAGGAWSVLRYFVKADGGRPEPARVDEVRGDRGSIAAGRDVTITTIHGPSRSSLIFLALVIAGTIALAAGLFGDRITATLGVATGGNVEDSTIIIDGDGTNSLDR